MHPCRVVRSVPANIRACSTAGLWTLHIPKPPHRSTTTFPISPILFYSVVASLVADLIPSLPSSSLPRGSGFILDRIALPTVLLPISRQRLTVRHWTRDVVLHESYCTTNNLTSTLSLVLSLDARFGAFDTIFLRHIRSDDRRAFHCAAHLQTLPHSSPLATFASRSVPKATISRAHLAHFWQFCCGNGPRPLIDFMSIP